MMPCDRQLGSRGRFREAGLAAVHVEVDARDREPAVGFAAGDPGDEAVRLDVDAGGVRVLSDLELSQRGEQRDLPKTTTLRTGLQLKLCLEARFDSGVHRVLWTAHYAGPL